MGVDGCAALTTVQDTKISEIMRPRVEVVAIEANSTMMDLYMLHQVRTWAKAASASVVDSDTCSRLFFVQSKLCL